MIDRTEIEVVAGRFGAPDTQIIRDHLISHVLAAIADWPDSNRVTFFGGTALCRTWLPDLRLSEDIDLLVDSPTDGDGLRTHISRRLRREFPRLAWTRLGSQHQVETWTTATDDLEVKVQFARRPEWQAIPIVIEPVRLRYSDLPEAAELRVPTSNGFAAMKLMAWFDRHTPRDLYDLAALADAGHIDEAAVWLVRSIAGYAAGHRHSRAHSSPLGRPVMADRARAPGLRPCLARRLPCSGAGCARPDRRVTQRGSNTGKTPNFDARAGRKARTPRCHEVVTTVP